MLMRQVQQRQISQRVTVTDRDVERFLSQQPSQQGQAFIERSTRPPRIGRVNANAQ